MNVKQEKEFKIGGKKRLIKFGTNASSIFCEKHDMLLSEYVEMLYSNNIQMMHMRDLVWSGLVAGARSKKQEIDFDEWQVGDWIDELDEETVQAISDLMNPSTEGESEGKPEAGKP